MTEIFKVREIFFLDCGGGFIAVCIYQNARECTLQKVNFTNVNFYIKYTQPNIHTYVNKVHIHMIYIKFLKTKVSD